MGEVKMTENLLEKHEKLHTTEANKMTSGQLNEEIERMKKLSRILGPSGISTIRLTEFEVILSAREDWGPRGAEVRVTKTS